MPTRKWGSELLVNTTTEGRQGSQDVAVLADGSFVVVWEDTSLADGAIRAQRFDAAGNRLGGEMLVAHVPGAGGFQSFSPEVCALANGDFYVTWEQSAGNDRYILGKVYDPAGALVRAQPVIFAFGFDGQHQSTALGAGSVVAWHDPDSTQGDILYRVFDAAGNGTDLLTANSISAGTQWFVGVAGAPDAEHFAITWASGDSLYFRLFDAGGAPLGAEVEAALQVFASPYYDVTWLNERQFAITFTVQDPTGLTDFNVQVRICTLNGAGTAAVPTQLLSVNTTALGTQNIPSIAALPDGGFVVAWEDDTRSADGSVDICLQAFNAAGFKVGQEMLVNTGTGGSQALAEVAALPDGRVVVTWTDFSATGDGDASGAAVRMQIVDPRDGVIVGRDGADRLYGHELVNDEISAGAGNDQLFGLRGDDVLYGGDGVDTLIGGTGADHLDGGSGSDVASYQTATAGVRVDLATPAGNTGDAAGDSYRSVVHLTGSSYADTLLGDSAGNTLRGGASSTRASGADRLHGRDGNDALYGFDANDQLYGGLGNDLLAGGAGSDTLRGEGGANVFVFDSRVGSDTAIDFVSSTDRLRIVQSGLRIGDGDAAIEGGVVRSAPGGFAPGAELVIFTSNIAGAITTSSAAATIGSASAAYAAGRSALFVVDNGSAIAVYLFTSSSANALVSASELSLLATLDGTAATALVDYQFSA